MNVDDVPSPSFLDEVVDDCALPMVTTPAQERRDRALAARRAPPPSHPLADDADAEDFVPEPDEATAARIPDDPDAWRAFLTCKPGKPPHASFHNLVTIFENTLGDRLTFDEMIASPCFDGRPMQDHDASRLRRSVEVEEQLEFDAGNVRDAIAPMRPWRKTAIR